MVTMMTLPDPDQILEVLDPLNEWAAQCHAASLRLVKSGVLPETARVARGTCTGVGGQHSWVCVEGDCYDPHHTVIDPTLWSYDDTVEGIWIGCADGRPHIPHGTGSIFEYGQPSYQGGEIIPLPVGDLSVAACSFLRLLGPFSKDGTEFVGLDREGWAQLAHAPVGNWPSGEIFAAMYEHPNLGAIIPIDIVGMATDLNPQGLYR